MSSHLQLYLALFLPHQFPKQGTEFDTEQTSPGWATHLVRKSSAASLALSICNTSLAFSDLVSKI